MTKRIALIGNMNNNFFALTRYLRDIGYDAQLFYSPRSDHFHPKADTYSLDYSSYCHEVNWLDGGFYKIDEKQVQKDIDGFDFYIGQGDEAAIAYYSGIEMDIYYPYGSDVYKYSYLQQEFSPLQKTLARLRGKKNKLNYSQMRRGTAAKYIKGAITNSRYILAEYTNQNFEDKLKGLNVKGTRHQIPIPFIYLSEYAQINHGKLPDTHWRSCINEIRKQFDFIILYHGRQEWKTFYNEFAIKNTHHLIEGFASYVKNNKSASVCLVMIEYGTDVAHSKALIQQLGISDNVKWLPKMYRKDLMYLISQVDVCTGEFGFSYLTFGTIVEAMVMKKPVIHFRDDRLYTQYETLYPLLNARTAEEIESAIVFAGKNRDAIKEMGEQAHDWIEKYFIELPVSHVKQLIESKQ